MQQRESAMHLESWSAITTLSTFFYADGAAISDSPCALCDSSEGRNTQRENEMQTKQVLKTGAAPAAIFGALAFFSTATPAAAAPVDYCRTDTSGMRGCGYSSLEQCQSMASGRGSNCYENPFPEGASASGKASNSAYAYQPKHHASKGARKPVEHQ
jgi:hypothetical protein